MTLHPDFSGNQIQDPLHQGQAQTVSLGGVGSIPLIKFIKDPGQCFFRNSAPRMPDVLEMPYRPPLKDAGEPGETPYTYRLGGPTCLAGDVIGDYSFDSPLREGSTLVFEDMALYTMVKTNTFNGMPLPALAIRRRDGRVETVKTFGYEDFKTRLS